MCWKEVTRASPHLLAKNACCFQPRRPTGLWKAVPQILPSSTYGVAAALSGQGHGLEVR